MELPPLPEPLLETNGDVFGHENVQGYTADQLRDYACRAVLMERERCAKIAASFATCGCNGTHGRCNEDDAPLAIAAAIREAP